MEAEASAFETSEMVATFLTSTPLVRESWRLCETASFSPTGIVIEQRGHVGYLAFSSIQMGQAITDPNWARLVPLDIAGGVVFGPLLSCRDGDGDGDQPSATIHAGLLELFLSLFRSQNLQHQILALKEQCKSIVITGHSLGGAIASLSTLWLLCHCYLQSVSFSPSVLCITFGSPLLGNESLSQAIHRERWGGNFCHVVSKHDIMPRLLLAPLATVTPQMQLLLQHWHDSMRTTNTPQFGSHQNAAATSASAAQLGDRERAEFVGLIMACLENSSSEEAFKNLLFWPFGNYLLCSHDGAICLENATSVIKMMHLMFMSGSPNDCIDDHLNYGECVGRISSQYLKRFVQMHPPESSYEAGLALALHSSGIRSQEPAVSLAKDCLTNARRLGLTPRIKCANLAVSLSKVVPYRAQIEWYKASCDESSDQMGYYDHFKRRESSKSGDQVNMNRCKLAVFWDKVIDLWESNQLPYHFHKRAKWVNAFHSYKLLVEPLEIGEYYRKGMHRDKGHYLRNGRPRRFQISDRWWKERRRYEKDNDARTTFASATQDSCFWARLEEAMELLANLQSENGEVKEIWENINKFDEYARRLVERKEVSKDVLAKNSSYTRWTEELKKLSSPLVFPVSPFP
ncbi:lipase-like PAD4 [Humulus lupulus]|uniref:lipase-like PAD4 n=1 Tax=Humulus lupulus TaxID=3486 RepID=UPI002B417A40|nr:lipase-like PAD4 [Humulus lupulus]